MHALEVEPRVIVALDFDSDKAARDFVSLLNPKLCRLKVGPVLFTRYGPKFIEELIQLGFSVFLDLKFHDIPNTVAEACHVAADLGVWMLTLHITGGAAMINAVRNRLSNKKSPLLIGITLLTSLDEQDLRALNISDSVNDYVLKLASFGLKQGLNGVVCSALEAGILKNKIKQDFVIVTPGIRLENDNTSDQKRIVTPQTAIMNGADYLVIGRSIIEAKNPLQQLEAINQQVADAVSSRERGRPARI